MLRAACTASHGLAREDNWAGSVMRFASTGGGPLPSTVRFEPVSLSSMDTIRGSSAGLRRGAERAEEESEPLAQLRPRNDLIDEAAFEKELGLAEPGRQLLADGAARHALA